VTSLLFFDSYLASGSKDTTIVVYDLVADKPEFKLVGHKDEVVSLEHSGLLISASKDSLIKFWDLRS